jgi:hypothetical protein
VILDFAGLRQSDQTVVGMDHFQMHEHTAVDAALLAATLLPIPKVMFLGSRIAGRLTKLVSSSPR